MPQVEVLTGAQRYDTSQYSRMVAQIDKHTVNGYGLIGDGRGQDER